MNKIMDDKYKTIYGIKIFLRSKLFCQMVFRKTFNEPQILTILHDIYSNLHTESYYYEVLLVDEKWHKFMKEEFRSLIDEEKKFRIGFTDMFYWS
jgi:hypothetical protein